MTKEDISSQPCSFPFCSSPPQWTLNWSGIQEQFSWIRDMDGVPQDPIYHAEGDVLIHTGMVAEAMVNLTEWRNLSHSERCMLFAAALLHDGAKPLCTKFEEDGRVSSRGHARKGEMMARRILWTGIDMPAPLPFSCREHIARLVRFHGLPLQFLEKVQPERAVIEASQSVRLDHVALLAEADVRGRLCADRGELLERVELFRECCKELHCYDGPRKFPTDHSRFVYFQSESGDPSYEAYDTTTFEVILMAGLPGVGKDTWIREHLPGWPVISLDALRKELKVAPEGDQGRVVQEAKERARVFMRQHCSFVWNATNVTRMLRKQLINFFFSYGARCRIVYLDAPFDALLRRNQSRHERVPEAVIYKLLGKLEVPDLTEAHTIEHFLTNS